MVEAPRASIYTISLHRPFADALVEGVIARHGADPMVLAGGMLILPNRRAVIAVRDAFIRRMGSATLLPRLVALGDGDLDEAAGTALDRLTDVVHPPAITAMTRQLRLASLIAEVQPGTSTGNALRLARTMASLIDQMQIESLDLAEFMALADGDPMAAHWQRAFDLLRLVLSHWPGELQRLGMIDRTDARNRMLHQTAEQWRQHGLPARFTIAAGISTSAPAVARLLRVVALSPSGSVVLPHLDRDMPDEQWQALGDDPRRIALLGEGVPAQETHPQYHIKLLLDRMGLARDEVELWSAGRTGGDRLSRTAFVRQVMAGAAFTDAWPHLDATQRALPGVQFYDLADSGEEAQTIALVMREALETPGRTAALVTADRAIARRVMAQLSRWGISADDSAGTPLSQTPAGEFVLEVLDACASGLAPVSLMSMLNHPFASGGGNRQIWLDRVRELDRLLRGPRPAAGSAAIAALIAPSARDSTELHRWWEALAAVLDPLVLALTGGPGIALDGMLTQLRTLLNAIAGDALWSGADGRALGAFLAEVSASAGALDPSIEAAEVADVLRQMMAEIVVRPPQGGHPRLFIWGLIESRLQRADVMILGGLNEGQWPQTPAPDPWLAPMVRRRLGLPGIERQIGLSAHDFGCALGAPNVIITRARRVEGTPTVPSRFRLRLEALLGEDRMRRATGGPHPHWARAIDAANTVVRCDRPSLHVPADRRPRTINVTAVDTLKADPFSFYAKSGLALSRLDPLDSEPTPAWRGTMVHRIMEAWLRGGDWSQQAMDDIVRATASLPAMNPATVHFWLPRVAAAARFFVATVQENLGMGRTPVVAATELRAAINHGAITLTGRPDRIDRLPNGDLAIIDYKTGSSPTRKAVEAGYAMQLGLLGLMAEAGAFTGRTERAAVFEYWRTVRTGDRFGEIDPPFYVKNAAERRMRPDSFVSEVTKELDALVASYITGTAPFVAKLVPEFAPYADYDQFMRLEEWTGMQDDAPPRPDADIAGEKP